MKKLLLVAVIMVAVTSFGLSRTRHNGTSKPTVANLPQCTLTYISEGIPEGTVGVPMQFQLEACCGAPPYRFEVVEGAFPAGLHLNQNGKISGKPTAVDDTTVFIRLTDRAGCSLTQAFVSRVNPAP